jgi:hypothetical protein
LDEDSIYLAYKNYYGKLKVDLIPVDNPSEVRSISLYSGVSPVIRTDGSWVLVAYNSGNSLIKSLFMSIEDFEKSMDNPISLWNNIVTVGAGNPSKESPGYILDACLSQNTGYIIWEDQGGIFFSKGTFSQPSLTYHLTPGWNLISIPVSTNPDPKVVFSGLPTWRFYAWNPITRSYLDKNHATLGIGKGYWLWVPEATSYQISGSPNTSSFTEIPLYSGWNMIGTPYNQAIPWDSLQVKRGSETVSLNQAVANGWVRGYAYYWESNSYKMLRSGGSFEPLKGYWFYAKVDGCTMVFYKP